MKEKQVGGSNNMINIAILGFGVVGSGIAEVIKQNEKYLSERLDGENLNIKYILDKRDFPDHELGNRVTKNYDEILSDEEVLIVIETMGGSHPAFEFAKSALEAGKSVVTSNKEVVANFGAELLQIAKDNNVSYLFEASVGGGIPLIRPIWQCLAANKIKSVTGILNGTCNYILTKMEHENQSFEESLKQAQSFGYAEANPAADVEGTDTCRKISILASLAFGTHIAPETVPTEGICALTYTDVATARELGYAIKLLGRCELQENGEIYAITCPYFVSKHNPLYSVEDVYNGICITGNMVGDVMFYGRGAGKLPTASAVMADVLDIINCPKNMMWEKSDRNVVVSHKEHITAYYVRTKADIAAVKAVFHDVNVIEKDGERVFLTPFETEHELDKRIAKIDGSALKVRVLQ